MSDFLEKLKKGMDAEPIIQEVSEPEVVKAEFVSSPVVNDEPAEEVEPPKKAKKKAVKKRPEPEEKEEVFFDTPVGELTVDVFQSGKDLIIRSAIGGIESEDLDIVIENDFVVIRGTREEEIKEEKKDFFFQECHWGSFKREISLPLEVDSSRAKAKLEKGILIIRMPIIERNSKTKVNIE